MADAQQRARFPCRVELFGHARAVAGRRGADVHLPRAAAKRRASPIWPQALADVRAPPALVVHRSRRGRLSRSPLQLYARTSTERSFITDDERNSSGSQWRFSHLIYSPAKREGRSRDVSAITKQSLVVDLTSRTVFLGADWPRMCSCGTSSAAPDWGSYLLYRLLSTRRRPSRARIIRSYSRAARLSAAGLQRPASSRSRDQVAAYRT